MSYIKDYSDTKCMCNFIGKLMSIRVCLYLLFHWHHTPNNVSEKKRKTFRSVNHFITQKEVYYLLLLPSPLERNCFSSFTMEFYNTKQSHFAKGCRAWSNPFH